LLKRIAVLLARQSWLRKLALSTPGVRDLAWRFVAGENLDAAITVVRKLGRRRIRVTLNHVGTHVHELPAAVAATDDVIVAIRRIRSEGLDANLSVKPTQIGLDIDDGVCRRELGRLLDAAVESDVFVWIDMEESAYVERTIALFEELRNAYGATRVGIVLQSYLRGHGADLERLIDGGARIRIVKGGYWESPDKVYRTRSDIDAAFARDVRLLLERGQAPAIATHDPAVITVVRAIVAERRIDPGSFEFQMLYGVRADLQNALARDGFQVRLYVPYGGDWFVYFLGCVRRIPGGIAHRVATRLGGLRRSAA
jgi:proline dehydrogenase